MLLSKPKAIYFVYGNHGKSPSQNEDYVNYLDQAFASCGYELRLSEFPVPGQTNVFLESCNPAFLRLVHEASQVPGTHFDIIATEFITGHTFNDFADNPPPLTERSKRLGRGVSDVLFPRILRDLAVRFVPGPYHWLKAALGFRMETTSNHYQNKRIWQRRYVDFAKVVPYCRSIWCVSPHQMKEYQSRFADKVKFMPIASWSDNPLQDQYKKDIDFLFTGTLTPYRKAILDQLEQRGYKVQIGPTTWPSFIRDHYVARTKVCLQILQSPQWKYPSVMRYHYLLCSGAVTVAEEASERCLQEKCILSAHTDKFIQTCEEALNTENFVKAGREMCKKYYEISGPARLEFLKLLGTESTIQGYKNAEVST